MTDRFAQLASALADRYRLERELGAGGMATVYLAYDLKHERRVALKVLRPELAAVIGAERFLAEIRTTANLQHPHILPLFDSGQVELPLDEAGIEGPRAALYYVMPYVEGESLRDRLVREGPLPIAETVRIGEAVASALDYAHRRGVIHRDIKPENILLSEDQALVADFGIALATDAAGGGRLTETGLSLGTPQYMSPEQALGERNLDARSDIYALGVMLYEASTGEPPFQGPTAQAIVAQALTGTPVPPSRRRRELPSYLSGAILTAMARDPARRFQTAAQLQGALSGERAAGERPGSRSWRWLGLAAGTAVAAVALLVLGWRVAARRQAPASAVGTTPVRSIIALPFENYSGDSGDAYLADGIPEEILGALAGVPDLVVRPMPQDRRFRNHPDLASIRNELDADIVLTGAVLRQADSIRVTVRPYNARKNAFLPAVAVTAGARNLFGLEDGLSQALITRLRLSGPASVVATATRQARPEDPAAHDSLLLARWYSEKRDCTSLSRAMSLLTAATRIDSAYARAWADLAQVSILRAGFCLSGTEEADRLTARRAVDRALRLDSSLAVAHMTLGFMDVDERDWAAAAIEFTRAVQLDSTRADIWLFRSWYYVGLGRLDSARLSIRRARQLDPSSSIIHTRVGTILYFSDSLEAAAAQLTQVLSREPEFRQAIIQLAAVYAAQNRCVEVKALQQAHGIRPTDGGSMGWALGRCGEGDLALRSWGAPGAGGAGVDWFRLAMIHASLGDRTRMLADLDRAVGTREWLLWQLGVEPAFRPYRSDPRFQALLRRLHLPVPG